MRNTLCVSHINYTHHASNSTKLIYFLRYANKNSSKTYHIFIRKSTKHIRGIAYVYTPFKPEIHYQFN